MSTYIHNGITILIRNRKKNADKSAKLYCIIWQHCTGYITRF